MTDFDAQFQQILSNPEAMAQIAQLARSLSGPDGPPPPAQNPTQAQNQAPNLTQSQPAPENQAQNPPPNSAQSAPENSPAPDTSPQPDPQPSQARKQAQNPADFPDLRILQKFLPLIKDLNGQHDSDARRLLYALRPYLPPKRQEKIERALRLARLWRLGKQFLSEWEG